MPSPVNTAADPSVPRRDTVLIVDDEPLNVTALVNLLDETYDTIVAKSGEEALAWIQGEQLPDLILLDVVMPGMDGYEVCRRLKQDPRTQPIPIIFISAMTDTEDEAQGLQLGAIDYIIKPFRAPIVKIRVANHLQLRRAGQERDLLIAELQQALSKIKTLSGLLPICVSCKKIRDDKGYWTRIEAYIKGHSDADFTHSLCPDCAQKLYPEFYDKK